MSAMTNNHISTEDAIEESGGDLQRMSHWNIEGVALENVFVKRDLGKGLRVSEYHFEFVGELACENDLPAGQPHMFIDTEHGFWRCGKLGQLRKKCRVNNFIGFKEQKGRIPLFDEAGHCLGKHLTSSDRGNIIIQRNAGSRRPD